MPMNRPCAALFAAGAAAAIWAAPAAVADDEPSCTDAGGNDTVCQSPGNVEINAAPPVVDYAPQYPYWEGDEIDLGPDHGPLR